MDRPEHVNVMIAAKLSAEGVCWHETAKGVAVLKDTCAPTMLVASYLITRLAEELSDQLSATRGNGYDLPMGQVSDGWEAVREGNAFVNKLPAAGNAT